MKQWVIDSLPRSLVLTTAEKAYNGWRVEKIRKTILDAQKKAQS
jgi:uncharacterized UBP type Zn finger protein